MCVGNDLEKWDLGDSGFFHDGASVHSAVSLSEFLSKSEMIVVPLTSLLNYLPDLKPYDFFILQKLEVAFKVGIFNDTSTIQARSGGPLAEIPTMHFVKFCERLRDR
jgi:hypothetical protein